jgi:hypothetical protein
VRAAPALALVLLAVAIGAGCGSGPEPATPAEVVSAAEPEPAPAETSPAAAPAPPESVAAAEPAPAAAPAEPAAPVTCELETYPSQVPLLDGSVHADPLPEGFAYNSVPASQGPHSPQALPWGAYAEPVPEINAVHNLEHGGVTVQFGSEVSQDTVALMLAWYSEDPNGIILAPYPALGDKIALAAWTGDPTLPADQAYRESKGHVLRCDGFDPAQFDDFLANYRAQAVERFPLEALAPGA